MFLCGRGATARVRCQQEAASGVWAWARARVLVWLCVWVLVWICGCCLVALYIANAFVLRCCAGSLLLHCRPAAGHRDHFLPSFFPSHENRALVVLHESWDARVLTYCSWGRLPSGSFFYSVIGLRTHQALVPSYHNNC